MDNIATIALCDHDHIGEYEHLSFTFSSLRKDAKSYAIMNKINHEIPFPAIYLNKSHVISLRDWCDRLIASEDYK